MSCAEADSVPGPPFPSSPIINDTSLPTHLPPPLVIAPAAPGTACLVPYLRTCIELWPGASMFARVAAGRLTRLFAPFPAYQARSSPHELVLGAGVAGEEVQRLLREREQLLGSGAYSKEDALILQLDERIRRCAAQAGAVG